MVEVTVTVRGPVDVEVSVDVLVDVGFCVNTWVPVPV
jgi:hypothetical protein